MRPTTPLILALTFGIGCAAGSDRDLDNDPPLSDIEDIFEGTPDDSDVPREDGKFDDVLPAKHTELRALMSPVKSQGRRGVCSIFSTAGYMEHLYIAEGTITDLDVSEQYLQWSAKFEVGSFPNTSGSNANFNLQAVNRFGIPAESVWPYETNQWGASDDADCADEDDLATKCYTNGHPTAEMKAAKKFHLPRPRFKSTRDIKGHIVSTNTGVVVGFTFFYQAWNHRKSELPTNTANWDQGIVLYPNDEDEELSLEKRAGHSILIIGWDDDMEVPRRDKDGELITDTFGNPEMEKGFYLFKNSWGTSGFGIDNEHGAGYGWISQRYLNQFGRARVAGLPTVEKPVEICGDELDNDGNGDIDCDDAACADDAACTSEGRSVTFSGPGVTIPDNDPAGVSSPIRIVGDITTDGLAGNVSELSVTVDIKHTFIGDLRVSLHRGTEAVTLHNRSGGGSDDIAETYTVTTFNGTDLAGDWKLLITDNAGIDVGELVSWELSAVVTD